jgi:hypothetical protein
MECATNSCRVDQIGAHGSKVLMTLQSGVEERLCIETMKDKDTRGALSCKEKLTVYFMRDLYVKFVAQKSC